MSNECYQDRRFLHLEFRLHLTFEPWHLKLVNGI